MIDIYKHQHIMKSHTLVYPPVKHTGPSSNLLCSKLEPSLCTSARSRRGSCSGSRSGSSSVLSSYTLQLQFECSVCGTGIMHAIIDCLLQIQYMYIRVYSKMLAVQWSTYIWLQVYRDAKSNVLPPTQVLCS